MALRDAILAYKPNTRLVETPAGEVLVRGFTLALKDKITANLMDGTPWRGLAIVHCALDPDTEEPMFTLDDLGALNALPAAFEVIIDVATEMSALSAEDMEELEGN